MSSAREQAAKAAGKEHPQTTKTAIRPLRLRPLRKSDGIFRIVGLFASKSDGGYSWRKHELPGV